MEKFIEFKNISGTNVKIINNFIKCSTKKFECGKVNLNLNTYTLKLPSRKVFEDDVYADNPFLLEVLPRACTIVTHSNKIISSLEGPTKFSGKTTIDEDPDDDQEESSNKQIYDHSLVESWAKLNQLEIVETEKANGKFAICKIINYQDIPYLLFGSKNNHYICSIDQIDDLIEKNKNLDIIVSILTDIKNNLSNLMTTDMLEIFNQGWSLAGELCDGQHFTDGDNTISWFGFFKNGNSMETNMAFNIIKYNNLKTVNYNVVFDSTSDLGSLDKAFLSARCKNNEGAVLRCRNIVTNQIILVKAKSVMYIVKRFMRQVLLRGYKDIESIKNRFIDAQTYHGLNTEKSIEVTNKLINFGLWMMNKTYPVSVLGCMSVNSVKGQLPNGFNTYWKKFLTESNSNEILVCPDDFGPFDQKLYLANTEIYHKRNYSDPAVVVFLQGLQGSGKSTIANWICGQLNNQKIKCEYIEQDIYWGDTSSCQGALYHLVANANGPKVIIVSRCNANFSQYKRYIEIIQKLPSIITFASPDKVDKLYLMISLSGIINRSQVGDKLMVGRFEYPIEKVVEFTLRNYQEFQLHTIINVFNTHHNDKELLAKCENINSEKDIAKFVQDNYLTLHKLRLSISEIGQQIIDIIKRTLSNDNTDLVLNQNPVYVGLAVNDNDKNHLIQKINTHVQDPNYTIYLHHCTQLFLGSQNKIPKNFEVIKPGHIVSAEIDALVIRKSDNACAFRIKNILTKDNKEVQISNSIPHITAKLPPNLKPMVSNSFVGLCDDSVEIIDFNYKLELTGFLA